MSRIWCVLVVWVALLRGVGGQVPLVLAPEVAAVYASERAAVEAGAGGAEAGAGGAEAGAGGAGGANPLDDWQSGVDFSSISRTAARATFEGPKPVEPGVEAQEIAVDSALSDGKALVTVDTGAVKETIEGIQILNNDGSTARGINPTSTDALGDYFGRGGASVDQKTAWPYSTNRLTWSQTQREILKI